MQTGGGNGGQESIIEWECAVEQGRAPREHESFLFYQDVILEEGRAPRDRF